MIRRLLKTVAALTGLAIMAVAHVASASSCPSTLPSVSGRVGRAQNAMHDLADQSSIEGKRDILWSNQTNASAPQVLPGIISGFYITGDRWSYNSEKDNLRQLLWWQLNYPQFVVYMPDGQTVAWEFGDKNYTPMAIWNSSYLAFLETNGIAPLWSTNYYCLLSVDNVQVQNFWGRAGAYDQSIENTTAASSINAGDTTVTVASPTGFADRGQIIIPGAGAAGAVYVGYEQGAPSGNVVTISPAIGTGAPTGTAVHFGQWDQRYTGASTQLSQAAAGGATALVVNSGTGFAANQYVFVYLTDGTLFESGVSSVSGTTVNISPGLPSTKGANSGATVMTTLSADSQFNSDWAYELGTLQTYIHSTLGGTGVWANESYDPADTAGMSAVENSGVVAVMDEAGIYENCAATETGSNWVSWMNHYRSLPSGVGLDIVNYMVAGSVCNPPQAAYDWILASYLMVANQYTYLTWSINDAAKLYDARRELYLQQGTADAATTEDTGGCYKRTFSPVVGGVTRSQGVIALLNPNTGTTNCSYTFSGTYYDFGDGSLLSGTVILGPLQAYVAVTAPVLESPWPY